MVVINIKFDDFKRLAENRRVYVFEDVGYFDFHYIIDSIIVKTTVLKSSIGNVQQFFSDKLFYGYIRLEFNIPNDSVSIAEFVPVKKQDNIISIIEQPVELVNEDIQKESVN